MATADDARANSAETPLGARPLFSKMNPSATRGGTAAARERRGLHLQRPATELMNPKSENPLPRRERASARASHKCRIPSADTSGT